MLVPVGPGWGSTSPSDVAAGCATGAALFAILSAGRVPAAFRRRAALLLAGVCTVVASRAVAEEVVWRELVLGVVARHASVPWAVAASSAGFALAHAPRQGLAGVVTHLFTGAAFGSLVAATGGIVAACVAHSTYNVLIVLTVIRAPGTAA